jgi:nitroreductase
MKLEEAIHGRRSVRAYTDKEVTDEQIKKILSAGMNAPSGMNSQTWRFVVIKDRTVRTKLSEIHPYAKMLQHAPFAILVCGDEDASKIPGMWIMDCSACTQNMLLTIHDLGLGGVWCGVYPNKETMKSFSKFLGLPKNIKPCSLVVFGHPAEKKDKNEKYNEEFVHHDKW